MTLRAVEIKAFVPAKDYALSQRFYQDLGFHRASEGGGIAYFHHGDVAFLLQDDYVEALAHNLVMHLLVEDVAAWRAHIDTAGLVQTYGVTVTDIVQQPWRMRDFILHDPSGVQWRIAQNTD